MGVSRVAKPRRRWTRWLRISVLILALWVGGVIGCILMVGNQERAKSSDVIIVLGAAVTQGEASPVFAARIRHGIELWRRGVAPKLLFTGGLGAGDTLCESEVGRREALKQGVPAAAILIEKESHYTWENLVEARRVMQAHGLKSAVIVSDPDHLFRSGLMAGELALPGGTSPTPYSEFRTWRTRIPFVLTEVWLIHSFKIERWLGRLPAS